MWVGEGGVEYLIPSEYQLDLSLPMLLLNMTKINIWKHKRNVLREKGTRIDGQD